MDNFAATEAEFGKRKVIFATRLKEPAVGKTVRVMGTGPSGFPTPFIVEHVDGRFHVYAERRRPQHPVAPPLTARKTWSSIRSTLMFHPSAPLSYPKTGGPFPAIVLVAGSGTHTIAMRACPA